MNRELLRSNGLIDLVNWFEQSDGMRPRSEVFQEVIAEKRILYGKNLASKAGISGSRRWFFAANAVMTLLSMTGNQQLEQYPSRVNYEYGNNPPPIFDIPLDPDDYTALKPEERLMASVTLLRNVMDWNIYGLDIDLFASKGLGWDLSRLFAPESIDNFPAGEIPPRLQRLITVLEYQAKGVPIYSVLLPLMPIAKEPRSLNPNGDVPMAIVGDQILSSESVITNSHVNRRRRYLYGKGSICEGISYLLALHFEMSAGLLQDSRLPQDWIYQPAVMMELQNNGVLFEISRSTLLDAFKAALEGVAPKRGDLSKVRRWNERQGELLQEAVARIKGIKWSPLKGDEAKELLFSTLLWKSVPIEESDFLELITPFLRTAFPQSTVKKLIYRETLGPVRKSGKRTPKLRSLNLTQEASQELSVLWKQYKDSLGKKRVRGRIDEFISEYNDELRYIYQYHFSRDIEFDTFTTRNSLKAIIEKALRLIRRTEK